MGAHKRVALFEEIVQAGSPDIGWERFLMSQRYHCTMLANCTAIGTLAMTANRLMAIPFIVCGSHQFVRIAINVTTLSTLGARLGIYANAIGNVYPGTRLLDAGEVLVTGTGLKEIVINQTLDTGLYWLVVVCAATPTIKAAPVAGCMVGLGLDGALANTPGNGYYVTVTYGALPDPFPAGATVNVAANPIVALFKQ